MNFFDYTLDDKEMLLIKALRRNLYSYDLINKLFENLDIATTNFYFLISLANLGFKNNWKYFPQKEKNWIAGILRQTQVRSKMLLSQISKLINRCNCPITFVGDFPMYCHYDKDSARVMPGTFVFTKKENTNNLLKNINIVNNNFPYTFTKINLVNDYYDENSTFYIEKDYGKFFILSPELEIANFCIKCLYKLQHLHDNNYIFKLLNDYSILMPLLDEDKLFYIINKHQDKELLITIINKIKFLYNSIWIEV